MATRKKWLDSSLPHLIGYVPGPVRYRMVGTFTKNKRDHYVSADDRRVVQDTGTDWAYSVLGWGLIGVSVFAFFAGLPRLDLLYFVIPALGLLLLGRVLPKKYVVLDRVTGDITYPDWFFKPPHTRPIAEVHAFWNGTGGSSGALRQELATNPPGSRRIVYLTMHDGDFDKSWSFILWYLDRNRPLPPGQVFDEFRERDFARRRSEGFPPPLFPSRFPTPEATAAQDAERRRHWRDEDHFGASDSAWY